MKAKFRKNKKDGGILVGVYEITYNRSCRTWQIWHPEYGFLGAYKFKDKAIERARKLFNEELKKTGS